MTEKIADSAGGSEDFQNVCEEKPADGGKGNADLEVRDSEAEESGRKDERPEFARTDEENGYEYGAAWPEWPKCLRGGDNEDAADFRGKVAEHDYQGCE